MLKDGAPRRRGREKENDGRKENQKRNKIKRHIENGPVDALAPEDRVHAERAGETRRFFHSIPIGRVGTARCAVRSADVPLARDKGECARSQQKFMAAAKLNFAARKGNEFSLV